MPSNKATRLAAKLFLLALPSLVTLPMLAEEAPSENLATAAFERLKGMEGSWHGGGKSGDGQDYGSGQEHHYRVSANNTVVMETMAPDSAHEMINMYHLDGDNLVLTHYCAGGNQPTMRLDLEASTPDDLRFAFTGGTNLDPETDQHIHAGRLVFVDDDHIESHWIGYSGGEEAGTMIFDLRRGEG